MLTLLSRSRYLGSLVLCLLTLGLLPLQGRAQSHWVVTWGTSPAPLSSDEEMTKSHLVFNGQTLREIVHTSLGGSQVRVRFSNVFGATPLRIDAASIAALEGAPYPLTFGGSKSFSIPTNAVAISDPVELTVPATSDLAISIYLAGSAKGTGIHYAAAQTSLVGPGDLTAAAALPEGSTKIASWVFLSGVDVLAPVAAGAVATFGDSITDGARSTTNANHRWPDILAQRLSARQSETPLGVLNAGIGGNRLLHDAAKRVAFGVNGLSRFDRDVLAQPGIRYLIVLEGINDIGHPGGEAPISESVTSDDLIGALSQLAERAHERGIKVFGATLTPFEAARVAGYVNSEKAAVRQRYNAWIRTTPKLDGFIDFDAATRDPAHPTQFIPAYDSGDHLHPNDAGYKAMGEAIDLRLFE